MRRKGIAVRREQTAIPSYPVQLCTLGLDALLQNLDLLR